VRFVVWALCAIGLFVSVRMQAKALLSQRGRLDEPSVVQTPRARLFAGVPNATFGIIYYALVAVAMLFIGAPGVRPAVLGAAGLAAAVSVYLAYSLLYVTRMPCTNCWIGHAVNWTLFVLFLSGLV
jgi:uncharacterized membrane protein